MPKSYINIITFRTTVATAGNVTENFHIRYYIIYSPRVEIVKWRIMFKSRVNMKFCAKLIITVYYFQPCCFART